MRSRAAGRPLALREAVADLLELLHGLARLAEEGHALADLELRGGRRLAARVLEEDPAAYVDRLREAARSPVDEAHGLERERDPVAARVEVLHARELGEGVFEVGGGGGAVQGQEAEVVVGPGGARALGILLRHLLEGSAGLVLVPFHVQAVAPDLEQRLVHGVGVGEAARDDVEVLEGLLELALRPVGPTVVEEAGGPGRSALSWGRAGTAPTRTRMPARVASRRDTPTPSAPSRTRPLPMPPRPTPGPSCRRAR